MKILISIYMCLFSFFSYAGILEKCRELLKRKEVTPSREWTLRDHDPQNQQTVIRDNVMIFIDEGYIFAKDLTTENYLHIKGLSKVTAIVLYGGNLAVLTNSETGNIEKIYHQLNLVALTEGRAAYQLENWDKFKWVKLEDDVKSMSVLDLGDGRTSLSLSSKLDPFTLEPL